MRSLESGQKAAHRFCQNLMLVPSQNQTAILVKNPFARFHENCAKCIMLYFAYFARGSFEGKVYGKAEKRRWKGHGLLDHNTSTISTRTPQQRGWKHGFKQFRSAHPTEKSNSAISRAECLKTLKIQYFPDFYAEFLYLFRSSASFLLRFTSYPKGYILCFGKICHKTSVQNETPFIDEFLYRYRVSHFGGFSTLSNPSKMRQAIRNAARKNTEMSIEQEYESKMGQIAVYIGCHIFL